MYNLYSPKYYLHMKYVDNVRRNLCNITIPITNRVTIQLLVIQKDTYFRMLVLIFIKMLIWHECSLCLKYLSMNKLFVLHH